jgi:hypothetical protein
MTYSLYNQINSQYGRRCQYGRRLNSTYQGIHNSFSRHRWFSRSAKLTKLYSISGISKKQKQLIIKKCYSARKV